MAIETPRGLLVACLRATGRPVYPINPMSVARYRDRHSVAGRKSDHGDSFVLANVLRTDIAMHRPLPAGSELAQAARLAHPPGCRSLDGATARRHGMRTRRGRPGLAACGDGAGFRSASSNILRPQKQMTELP